MFFPSVRESCPGHSCVQRVLGVTRGLWQAQWAVGQKDDQELWGLCCHLATRRSSWERCWAAKSITTAGLWLQAGAAQLHHEVILSQVVFCSCRRPSQCDVISVLLYVCTLRWYHKMTSSEQWLLGQAGQMWKQEHLFWFTSAIAQSCCPGDWYEFSRGFLGFLWLWMLHNGWDCLGLVVYWCGPVSLCHKQCPNSREMHPVCKGCRVICARDLLKTLQREGIYLSFTWSPCRRQSRKAAAAHLSC